MAILKDTNINGNLTITGDTTINSKLYLNGIINTSNNSLLSIADVINNHQKQIDALSAPTSTYTLEISGGAIKFWKIGRLVYASCTSVFSPYSGVAASLGTIPEAFRPVDTMSVAVNGTASWKVNNWLSVYFYIDGRLLYSAYSSSQTEVYFSTLYMSAS